MGAIGGSVFHGIAGFRNAPKLVSTCKPKSCHSQHIIEQRYVISNNVVCATNKGTDQPAHMRSLIRAFAIRLNII